MQKATSFIILLILIISATATATAEEKYEISQSNQMKSRKLLVDIILDYDLGGPNTRHDPRRGKPGFGGKKP
ncbi:hypothetical protein Cni_G10931 [Canna indica]|uniref:Uncharacterized protein n=1 Tax=Canna indica TaxID=4628 RepID=A0AAQ3K542_9LILI|nr:hypothetical protein Cni_G10931 [Canna indica]